MLATILILPVKQGGHKRKCETRYENKSGKAKSLAAPVFFRFAEAYASMRETSRSKRPASTSSSATTRTR